MNSRFYKSRLASEVDRLTGDAMKRSLADSEVYREYIRVQINKSLNYQTRDLVDQPQRGPSLEDFARRLDHILPEARGDVRLLCVGCRNNHELDYLQTKCGIGHAEGLDLFSTDPRITVGDMHKMPFPDGRFDVLYSCHSLEHSFDFRVALAEFVRVVKSGGLLVVEAPTNFKPSATDRCDVRSTANLIDCIPTRVSEILFQENTAREKQSARIIVRIAK